MTYRHKTGEDERANRRTRHRPRVTSAAVTELMRGRVPIDATDIFFALSLLQLKKRECWDLIKILALMQFGAKLAAKIVPYVDRRLTGEKFDLRPALRDSIDFTKLTDEELEALERILAKSQVTDDFEKLFLTLSSPPPLNRVKAAHIKPVGERGIKKRHEHN